MCFSILEYVLPPVIPLVLSVIVAICFNVGIWIKYRVILKTYGGKKVIVESDWVIAFLLVTLMFYLAAVFYWGELLNFSNRAIGTGVVEETRHAPTIALFYNATDHRISHPSYVMIDGTKYFILSDSRLKIGQEITFFYCPEGNTILEWVPSTQPLSYTLPLEEEPPSIKEAPSQKVSSPFFSGQQLIFGFALTLIMLVVFQKALKENQAAFLQRQEVISEGTVAPRPIHFSNSPLEFLISLFTIFSFWGDSIPLRSVWSLATAVFWGIRWLDLETYIVYGEDEFTYVTPLSQQTIRRSDVVKCGWITVRSVNQNAFRIQLRSGKQIKLSHVHFSGLGQFQNWLEAEGEFPIQKGCDVNE